ncbi:hypothetical protein DL767_001522 [Monosporascus sp. MG133]|nr:hypothetical protein DL767_001522 [Monosporascus sp. MG133]
MGPIWKFKIIQITSVSVFCTIPDPESDAAADAAAGDDDDALGRLPSAAGSQPQDNRHRGVPVEDLTRRGAYGLAAVHSDVRAGLSAGVAGAVAGAVAGSVVGGPISSASTVAERLLGSLMRTDPSFDQSVPQRCGRYASPMSPAELVPSLKLRGESLEAMMREYFAAFDSRGSIPVNAPTRNRVDKRRDWSGDLADSNSRPMSLERAIDLLNEALGDDEKARDMGKRKGDSATEESDREDSASAGRA